MFDFIAKKQFCESECILLKENCLIIMYAIPARRDSTTPKATIRFFVWNSFLNGGTALVNRIGC